MSDVLTRAFVAPRPVSAGEFVLDPATGVHGYVKSSASAGASAQMITGSGFVETFPDPTGAARPGSLLFMCAGMMCPQPPRDGAPPCAEVISASRDPETGLTTALIRTL